ncbi:type II toxin-antitoxin system VapC family toxin [Metapseudomonas furukawaii]|jgi:tRNA(fMet)-specific endonuclease VapC|uniref:Ribonuclease VapC n=1 Tax=Metapseudomonas furukawaii TaxID=1149133 RepID=A0AAD1C1V3_METFU|nr:type II toxin-antitoxin system VapC family toxin [Pseudomonas furukawaii]ELS28447.1 VapC toxin protein [Pseudomonas furukawaii]WAG77068.1 type II toxin-antitoxin system VapC family toxin [Pseudomonas furukawaii]BAU75036.1 VapC toxin protein [Pseudomonas furukawaii]
MPTVVTYMLDTNICSFIIRKNPPQVLERLQCAAAAGNRLVISAITYAELRYGAASPRAPKALTAWIDALVQRLDEILPWNDTAVEASANLMAQLLKAGTPIGPNDTGIAGHALSTGCIVVTNNTREFLRVPGLLVEDWAAG